MPNRIESDSIIRQQELQRQDSAKASNADYVTQLDETSSLMPPEKPFETEKAQNNSVTKENSLGTGNDEFVQHTKESSNEIDRLDKTNETKLHLLNNEHKKIADQLKVATTKKEIANLESLISDVEQKIDTYRSKIRAGATSGNKLVELDQDTENNGEEGGENEGITDTILAAVGLAGKKKEDEEEEEGESEEKEKAG